MNKENYTFRPKLTPFAKKNLSQNIDKSKSEDKIVNRMRKARVEH